MTREEAIVQCEILRECYRVDHSDRHVEALKMAIEALKAQPCEDAVSREAALDAIKNNYRMAAIDAIENLPPVTPKQRTGKWAKTGQSYVNPSRFRNYCCSECGWELDEHIRVEPHYCPNCGAKMEGESEYDKRRNISLSY